MHVHLAANATDVYEETRDGARYLIAEGVAILKPKVLDGGYVPAANVETTTELENTHGGTGWADTSVIVGHHVNEPGAPWHESAVVPEGAPVLAANDAVQEHYGVGRLENDRFDGEYVRADVAVNADRAAELGGDAAEVLDRLESIMAGENATLDVSTQYLYANQPPGEYDGAYRSEVAQIVSPDGLALLPEQEGACSVADGCGITPPDATAEVAVNAADADLPTVALGIGHNLDHSDSRWRGLFGVLNRIASDLDRLTDRVNAEGAPVSDDMAADLRETARDVNEAIGMARRVDEELGGDGTLPDGRDADEGKAAMNADGDTVARATLLEAANQEGFGEWPWSRDESGIEACKAAMEREGQDPELCFAWANSDGVDVGSNTDEPAESGADAGGDTDDHAMHVAINQDARLDAWAELVAQISDADVPLDVLDLWNVHMLAADAIPAVSIEDVKQLVNREELQAGIDADELLDRAESLAAEADDVPGINDGPNTMQDRTDLIDELAEQTDLKRESLEGMGDTCLQRTHESFLGGGGDDPDDEISEDEPTDADADDDTDAEDLLGDYDSIDDAIEAKVEERVAANERRSEVDRVIEQSAEWTAEDREELESIAANHAKAWERIKSGVSGDGFQMPAATGPGADVGANDDEPDVEFPTATLEGDD